jgi:hypothetical protein
LQFALWDSLTVGLQIGSTQTVSSVSVANGIFTVTLDFGATAFPGSSRFLEISTRATGAGSFTLLSPRQQLTSTPYAVRSLGSTSADSLSSACLACVQDSNISSLAGSKLNGTIPVASIPAGSGNYIQNTSTTQAGSNFNISGGGTAGGTLSGNVINATTQYNLNGSRVLIAPGTSLFVGGGTGGGASTGADNVFVGSFAGSHNTTGFANTFFGPGAGGANTMGHNNAFFGSFVGNSNTMGFSNAFFGSYAGSLNVDGGDNAFFGGAAGQANTSGSGNSFLGNATGQSNTTENLNTFVGASANGMAGITNATAIGANASVTQSNSLVLGSINGVNGATANTNVGIGVTAPSYPLSVVGAGGSGLNQGAAEFANNGSDTAVRINNTSSGGHTYTLFSSGAGSTLGAGNFNLYDATAGQPRLSVNSTGNVGIGTTSPEAVLNVVGNSPTNTQLHLQGSGNAGGGLRVFPGGVANSAAAEVYETSDTTLTNYSRGFMNMNYPVTGAFNIFTQAGGSGTARPLVLGTDGTEAMRIDVNGKVGIGTTGPKRKLDVEGGDILVGGAGNGVILKSPDGATCKKLTIDNAGAISLLAVTCP